MNSKNSSERSIREIKDIMERSTTFVSLSGMSGVISGILAMVGVYVLYVTFNSLYISEEMLNSLKNQPELLNELYIIFTGIFISALLFAFGLSYLKAKSKKEKIFNSSSKRFAFNLFVPIVTAIFIILALIRKEEFWLLVPSTLIFYGLALINTGKYSRPEVIELGIGCIISGILSMYYIEFSIVLWGIGFGLLNIITGISMYFKYDRKR